MQIEEDSFFDWLAGNLLQCVGIGPALQPIPFNGMLSFQGAKGVGLVVYDDKTVVLLEEEIDKAVEGSASSLGSDGDLSPQSL